MLIEDSGVLRHRGRHAVKGLTSIIEPVVIVFMGLVIGASCSPCSCPCSSSSTRQLVRLTSTRKAAAHAAASGHAGKSSFHAVCRGLRSSSWRWAGAEREEIQTRGFPFQAHADIIQREVLDEDDSLGGGGETQ